MSYSSSVLDIDTEKEIGSSHIRHQLGRLPVEDIEPIKSVTCSALADRPQGWKNTQ
jgi:hypothetical protein